MKSNKGPVNFGIIIASIFVLGLAIYFILPNFKKDITAYKGTSSPSQFIAVRPFLNLSKDNMEQYFCEGLTEDIRNSLANLNGLKVSASSSSFKDTSQNINIQEEGKKLGAGTILEGTVQLQGDRLIIITKLFNVNDGANFWSAKYDENIDDIFALQEKIVNDIGEKLQATLIKDQQNNVEKRPTKSLEAYRLFLKAHSLWNHKTPPDLKNAISLFQEAIKIDSSFATAYSGLADCYTALGYGSFIAPKDAFPKALEAATKALALDSTLAEPHASLGFYNFYFAWDWAAAEQEFRKAISLNKNYALEYDWYGYYLTAMKRYDEAKIIFEKAKELDPLSAQITTDIGFSAYYRGSYDLAESALKSALQIDSNFVLAHIWLGRIYQLKKMYPETIDQYKKALRVAQNWPVALTAIGNAYGENKDRVDAQNIMDTLISLSSKKFVTSYGKALVYTCLNETDEAFFWLDKAYDERSNWLVWLKLDPRWGPIKDDKRFRELINKVGLPE